MKKYICTVCGYVYDEAKGIPEEGILPGSTWDSLPDDWVCPLCGASKAEFREDGGDAAPPKPVAKMNLPADEKEMSLLEFSALCSNLAQGCEKQYKVKEAQLFTQLAQYFKADSAPAAEADMNMSTLLALVDKDLSENFPTINAVAADAQDRGALRALVWSEKVTRILKSLLTRYEKEGDSMLENTGVYVCTICGFVYVGDNPPKLCPVCKVPNWKFEKIEGRAI